MGSASTTRGRAAFKREHDPENPDNCPPRCKECRRETLRERGAIGGPLVEIARFWPSVKPSLYNCVLACGHTKDLPCVGGHSPPKRTHCNVATCTGAPR